MSLFQKSVTNKYLKSLDNDKVNNAFDNFKKFYGNKLRLHNIMQLKEENYQEGFLREIFVETLGYTINPDENYNLTTEYKNQKDSRKADGAIIQDGKAIGVIELKSTKTKNLESIKEQAFSYKNNQPGCRYVVTSNFQSLRFYVDDATEYEEFNLFELAASNELSQRFMLFYLLLSKESIFNNLPDKLKKETKFHENDISDKLYKDYKHFKDEIFKNLVKNNPQYDKLNLFKKSQKLLDRFLFVLFAEDGGLIPPNAISKIIEQWKQLQELDEYKPLYSRFQKLFSHLDKGHKYKEWGEIPAYNGGLFREDEILDNPGLKIDDDVLLNDSKKLTAYDFNTEVDVNILGHIFEHSLNEIEEITAELQGEKTDKSKSKRKKDGIFYTPKYITKYIVENTIGTLCKEKKQELQINDLLIDDTYRKKDGKLTAKAKKLFTVLEDYKKWMLELKVLDPACGSGAFLNQALDFFIKEHNWIADRIQEITGDASRMYVDTDKAILENNIYGVDINEESVEIAKLSLWLRTAQRGRPLSDLSGNIKCGNSLIDDPEIAGDKAFDWHKEFPHVFNPKIKKRVYQKIPENKPDYVKLVKEKSKEAQDKAEQAANLSKEALEISKQVYEYAGKIDSINEPDTHYDLNKGGFDVVLGNPPYVFARDNISKELKEYYTKNYVSAEYQVNTYLLFVEQTIKIIKDTSNFGLIIPNAWLMVSSAKGLRNFILKNCSVNEIINLAGYSFEGVNVETIIIIATKTKQKSGNNPVKVLLSAGKEFKYSHNRNQIDFEKNEGFEFKVFSDETSVELTKKIRTNSKNLDDLVYIKAGLQAYETNKGEPKQTAEDVKNRPFDYSFKYDNNTHKYLEGKNVGRYFINWSGLYLQYGKHLASPRTFNLFDGEKIIIREITGKYPNSIISTYSNELYLYNRSNIAIIKREDFEISLKYVVSVLNSQLMTYYFVKNTAKSVRKMFPKIILNDLRKFPFKEISKEAQQPFIEKADLMLSLNKGLQTKAEKFIKRIKANLEVEKITTKLRSFYDYDFKTFVAELKKQKIKLSLAQQDEWEDYFDSYKQEINNLQQQINQTDKEIDNMVYELYELTPEEIEIVEES